MHRVQWFEIHDSPRCPRVWRECLVEFLSLFARVCRPYAVVADRLREAVTQARATQLVDLCSGAGAPALTVQRALRDQGRAIPLVLTDKFPHPGLRDQLAKTGAAEVRVVDEPVDALAVPGQLKGFRTLFTAFHHFAPAQARAILADAVEQGEGIGVFEYSDRNFLVWGIALFCVPLLLWIATPFMRPFRAARLLWTYLLPVLPLIGVWDGFVSCLRTYSPDELKSLTASLERPGYCWEIGRVHAFGGCWVTYCLGWPQRGA